MKAIFRFERQAMNYPANSITVLDTNEAIRKRPSMYIGDIRDKSRPTTIVQDVVVQMMCESKSTKIKIDLYENGRFSVSDEGEGIAVSVPVNSPKIMSLKLSEAEALMTIIHCGKFSPDENELAAVCANSLSSHAEMIVWRDGREWRQQYVIGKPTSTLTDFGDTERSGMSLSFKLDDTIMPEREFQLQTLVEWCARTATIPYEITDHRTDQFFRIG